MSKTACVKCIECGKLHSIDSYTYISVQGNICIGHDGDLVGNNIGDDNKVVTWTIVCVECWEKFISENMETVKAR